MTHVSDIKLIRTDTTLDLSQKAEKGMLWTVLHIFTYSSPHSKHAFRLSMWDWIEFTSPTLRWSLITGEYDYIIPQENKVMRMT